MWPDGTQPRHTAGPDFKHSLCAGSFVTSSFTPPSNSLLVVAVAAMNSADHNPELAWSSAIHRPITRWRNGAAHPQTRYVHLEFGRRPLSRVPVVGRRCLRWSLVQCCDSQQSLRPALARLRRAEVARTRAREAGLRDRRCSRQSIVNGRQPDRTRPTGIPGTHTIDVGGRGPDLRTAVE
jgi:hypothetical protein